MLRNLAELAIEERTSLRRAHTLWREHLYERSGFNETGNAAAGIEARFKKIIDKKCFRKGVALAINEMIFGQRIAREMQQLHEINLPILGWREES